MKNDRKNEDVPVGAIVLILDLVFTCNWIIGWIKSVGKTNSKVVVFTRFSIHLHIRELEIIKELSKIFKLYVFTKFTSTTTVTTTVLSG